jgi:chromosome segregation and condensation protein ScpB
MRLHVENDRLDKRDEDVIRAIHGFGPISIATIYRIVGTKPDRSIKRLQRCGYLAARTRGTVGYMVTESGKRAFSLA